MEINDFNACRLQSEKRWNKMDVRVQQIEDNIQAHKEELDKQADILKDIQKLSTSVSILANNMELMLKEQQSQNTRLQLLENKPAKRWESIVDKIVMLIVGGVVGFALYRLGLQ